MRFLVPLLACLGAAALEPGQAVPAIAAGEWVRPAPAPAGLRAWLAWSSTDDDEAVAGAAIAAQTRLVGRGTVCCIRLGEASEAKLVDAGDACGLAAIDAGREAEWAGDDQSLPLAILAGDDGSALWIGPLHRLDGLLARIQAGRLDGPRLAEVGRLLRQAELAEEGDDPKPGAALRCVEAVLAIDPLYEDAIRDRVQYARWTDDETALAAALDAVPVGLISGGLANELAWDRLIDEDLQYRCVPQAFALTRRAVAAEPDNGNYLDTYARALFSMGMLDEALQVQRKAVELAPDNDPAAAALDYYLSLLALRERFKGRGALLPPLLRDGAPALTPIPLVP